MKNVEFNIDIKVVANFEYTQQSLLIITFKNKLYEKYFINALDEIPKKLAEFIEDYVRTS